MVFLSRNLPERTHDVFVSFSKWRREPRGLLAGIFPNKRLAYAADSLLG